MNFTEYCDICGQRLTEASGKWRMTFTDFGMYHHPTEKMLCCAYCHDGFASALTEYAMKRRAERG